MKCLLTLFGSGFDLAPGLCRLLASLQPDHCTVHLRRGTVSYDGAMEWWDVR